ncbi:MAG: mechanosensitive ion channel domain-containing protein [Candidatus Binatia bacterium]
MPKARVVLPALLLLVLVRAPVCAEPPSTGTVPAPEAGAAPTTAAADGAAAADDWIRPEDIVDRADSLGGRLEARRVDPATMAAVEEIRAAIQRLDHDLAASLEQARTVLAGRASLGAIQDARRELEGSARSFSGWKETLEVTARRLGENLGDIAAAQKRWERTRDRRETLEAGAVVLRRVETSLASLARSAAELQAWREKVLAVNDRLLDRSTSVEEALDKLEAAAIRESASVIVPDDVPLWQRDFAGQLAKDLPQVAPRFAAYQRSTHAYLLLDARPLLLQALLAVLLMLALRPLPGRARDRLALSRVSPEAARLLARPYAIALLLALIVSPALHPTAPQRVMQVLGLLALFPVARILALANEPANLSLYLGLCVLLVLDRVTTALSALPAVATLLFLVALGVAFILAFEYRRRLRESGGSAWLVRLLTAAMGGLAFAGLAEVAGWASMAALVGRGILVSATGALYVYAATISLEALIAYALASPALRSSRFIDRNQALVQRWAAVGLRLAGFVYWIRLLLGSLGLRSLAGEAFRSLLDAGISVGALSLSIGGVLAFVLTLVVAMMVSRLAHEILEDEVFPRTNLPRGIPHALLTLSRYAIFSLGFLLALAAAGVQLGQLGILLGGLGVGIGLGLQDVVKNFAAGITILLERRVHVGDAVQIPDKNVFGRVLSIGMRASVVRNWNGAEVVMPNDDLVSGTVTNWTLSDRAHRVEVKVGVAYGTDPSRVIDLLLGVARSNDRLLRTPPPTALFTGFGESSLDFVVRAWSDEDYETASAQTSELAVAVHAALREAGIEIPFPQREVNITNVSPQASEALKGGDRRR